MMLRILFIFILLLASVCLGIQLNADPGYVLISINHWAIESTLWIALFALFLLCAVVHLFLQLCHKISRGPGAINTWSARRRAQKAQAITKQGLIEYSEGYWQKAQNHLIKALPNAETPLLNYLTAARAAQKMGDSQLRDHYLREAQQSMPEAKIAVELTQAQLQLANHQWEQALATLRHLHDLAPRHPYVLQLLMQLYEQVRDWPQLIALLPNLKKYRVISDQVFQSVQQNAYIQTLIDLEKQNQPEAVHHLFNTLPKTVRNNPEIIREYVTFLLKLGEYKNAEHLLRQCLRHEFNPKFIELYSRLPCTEPQLAFIESLLKKNPHSAALFFCLGRLSTARQLWGKAREYLEQSIALNPTPIAYNELGLLYERLNDSSMACTQYKKGLELATTPFKLNRVCDRHRYNSSEFFPSE